MFNDSAEPLTDLTRPFLQPQNSTHRQYEALRAYFVERLPSAEAARRGGYTAGSFRVLVHQFRQNPDRQFFLPAAKGPKTAPKADRLREKVIALRKQNLSIYDISRILGREVEPLSPVRSRSSSSKRALPAYPGARMRNGLLRSIPMPRPWPMSPHWI